MMEAVLQFFKECDRARAQGDLIRRVSASDKEYHFQNWVKERLDNCGLNYDEPGRNTYPDFRLVDHRAGFEVKGLAWPGREADYDANSQVPAGEHNGRQIYYVFGRYPSDVQGHDEYPVTDLVVCHGSFLNATLNYVHKNKSFRGFGSYGDILIRDRKMYVVPTPFFLVKGTVGQSTLITPKGLLEGDNRLTAVGELVRVEVDELVGSYEFDLTTNGLTRHMVPNPSAGVRHEFLAHRVRGHGESHPVSLRDHAET